MNNHHNRAKLLEETVLYRGWSTLKKYLISYTRHNGNVENHVREIYDSGDGAAVLMYNPDERKILLIRQFRLPVLLHGHPDGFIIECCAGMLDELNPEQAILKEIKEETGYTVKVVTKIFEAYATPGAHMEKIHFYTVKYDTSMKMNNGGGVFSEQEDIELLEYSYDELAGLLYSSEMVDAKTIILLQWAIANL
ncbi:MAG: NUDIX domain-containing protein [Saprospiraceae bacterium]|nr:NUDIX domain-containing protein [Saprospiraceae bacterium]MBL0100198.1 NUDIX domain-containing protein [Saprospiraceae bacterium]